MKTKKEWRCPFWAPLVAAVALSIVLDRYVVFLVRELGGYALPLVHQGMLVSGLTLACLCYFRKVTTSLWVITQEDVAGTLYPWVLAFAIFGHLGNVTRSDVEEFVILAVSSLTAAYLGLVVVKGIFQVTKWRRVAQDLVFA